MLGSTFSEAKKGEITPHKRKEALFLQFALEEVQLKLTPSDLEAYNRKVEILRNYMNCMLMKMYGGCNVPMNEGS